MANAPAQTFDRIAQSGPASMTARNVPAAGPKAPLREVSRVQDLFDNEEARRRVAQIAASHMNPERMMRLLANAVRTTPLLAKCTPLSLLGAFMTSASLGLEPNTPLGHAYLIPFKNNREGTVEVQLIIGYKGLIDLARRSGHIVSIHADVVRDGDEFSFEYGSNAHLRHIPGDSDEASEPRYAYAHAKLKDGGEAFEVMPWKAVLRIRNASKGFQYDRNSPWKTHADEMAKKTAIRRLAKSLPLTIEMANANHLDEAADRGQRPAFDSFAFDGLSGEAADVIEGEVVEDSEADEPQKAAAPPKARARVKPQAAAPEAAAMAQAPEALVEEIELGLEDAATETLVDQLLATYAGEIGALPEALAAQVRRGENSRRAQILMEMLTRDVGAAPGVTALLKVVKEHRAPMIARLRQLSPAAAEQIDEWIRTRRAELEREANGGTA